MEIQLLPELRGRKRSLWEALLSEAGLRPEEGIEETVLVWDGDCLIATGSRRGNLFLCLATAAHRQGEGLTASVITALRQSAFRAGHRHLFLYTKPKNRDLFSSLFFYPVAQGNSVLLMEDREKGIGSFLETLPKPEAVGECGCVVMNCNPFTLGHRYLVEEARKRCDHLIVLVLSEDKSRFSAADRLEMVRMGVADLDGVTVLPTGPYLVSSATFPTYFLPDREQAGEVQCQLDVEIFTRYYAPYFGITKRFLGTEPFSPVTHAYNTALCKALPEKGVEVTVIDRLEQEGVAISASRFRKALEEAPAEAKKMVPATTWDYIQKRNL